MMWTIQFVCAKIGMVTGGGLARVLRKHYSPSSSTPSSPAWRWRNTINAGVDIGAIAAAMHLLVPVSVTVLIVPIALTILAIQIFGSYRLLLPDLQVAHPRAVRLHPLGVLREARLARGRSLFSPRRRFGSIASTS